MAIPPEPIPDLGIYMRQRMRQHNLNAIDLARAVGKSRSWAAGELLGNPERVLRRLIVQDPEKAGALARVLEWSSVNEMASDLRIYLFGETEVLEAQNAQNIIVRGYTTSAAAAKGDQKNTSFAWIASSGEGFPAESLMSVYVDESAFIAEKVPLGHKMWVLLTTELPEDIRDTDVGLYFAPSLNQAVWQYIAPEKAETEGTLIRSRNPLKALLLTHEDKLVFVGLKLAMISTREILTRVGAES